MTRARPRHRAVRHWGLDRGTDWGLDRTRRPRPADTINAMFDPFWAEANNVDNLFARWVSAAHDARFAWDMWLASATRDRGNAYARYRASLDREEQAAAVLAAAVRGTPRRFARAADLPAAA